MDAREEDASERKEDLKELHHEALPGFKTALLFLLAAGAVYLAVILFNTLNENAHL